MSVPAISFLVVCKDNYCEVVRTFNSIFTQMSDFDEILIVDSSCTTHIREFFSAYLSIKPYNIVYRHIPPRGVYDAQNYCIKYANKDWLCFINSGDLLMQSGRSIIHRTMNCDCSRTIYVFGQSFSFSTSSPKASFFPSRFSLWPHQSIVYKKELHHKYGDYNTSLSYCADQIFFAQIRKYESYVISHEITSFFVTDGLSSGFSLAYSKELWCLYRILQYDITTSFLLSFVLPFLKAFLKLFLPKHIIHKIQATITSRRSRK